MKFLISILSLFFFSGALAAQCLQLQACPAGPVEYCDYTANHANLWNEPYWTLPGYNLHDLPEEPVDICFYASDTCAGANLDIQYLLFLDLDGNGTQETVVNSANLPGPNTVNYDNAGNPNYAGGTPRAFDERPAPAAQRYGFALEQSGTAANRSACIRWNTQEAPGVYHLPELPYGTHRVQWIVSNGLGETDTCETTFVIKDCKKPTVVCLNGLAVNLMPTQMITLWASDFLQYVEDNSTPSIQIQYGIRKSGAGTGFPYQPDGVTPQQSVTYDCTELGTQLVELWAKDLAGNSDFCEVYLIIQDGNGNCHGDSAYLDMTMCARQWCTGAVVTGVEYGWVNNNSPSGQPMTDYAVFAPDGCYRFDTLIDPFIIPNNWWITPVKEDDPLNGVRITDLVRINLHILGLAPLPSPYAMVAADANRSGSITTFDVVEIRKLLTGSYNAFPNNTSWIFVPAAYAFPNPANPFQELFPEHIQTANLTDSIVGNFEFVAIKTGDVDCSAIPGLIAPPEDRSVSFLQRPDRQLLPGEVFDLPVYPAEPASWLGFQMGLQFDPDQLAVEAVVPGNLPNWDAYTAAQPRPGLLNLLWYDIAAQAIQPDQPLFTLRLRALAPLQISEALHLAGNRLRPEAYTAQSEPRDLQLRFSGAETAAIGRPYPNPTNAGVRIELPPASGAVCAEIRDSWGRLVWRCRLDAPLRQLDIPAAAFPAGGIYFWQLEAGAFRKSGKILRE